MRRVSGIKPFFFLDGLRTSVPTKQDQEQRIRSRSKQDQEQKQAGSGAEASTGSQELLKLQQF